MQCDPNTPWPPRQPSGTGSGSGASMGETGALERPKGTNGAMEQGNFSSSCRRTYNVGLTVFGFEKILYIRMMIQKDSIDGLYSYISYNIKKRKVLFLN